MPTAAGAPPDKANRATAVESVMETITDGIKDGRYAPGQRLVEADLTAGLGVSRGPLREALGRLAAEGLLELEPYRGAAVRRLTREEVVDLFRVRELLEGEAARLAAIRIDDSDHRGRLEAGIDAVDAFRREGDSFSYMDENARFHELIVELSRNRLLARMIGQLQVHAFRLLVRRMVVDSAAVKSSIRDHDEVAAAVLAGDGRAAERTMRAHVRRSGEMILGTTERSMFL